MQLSNLQWRLGCTLALIAWVPTAPAGEKYPVRPIRMLIPFPAGGASDLIARTIGERLAVKLGQPIVVDSRPGAGGRLATELLARAEPDGYTLLVGTVGAIGISSALYKKLPYNVQRDLLPITQVAEVINVLVVNATTGVKTVKELIDWSKKRSGDVRFGSSGPGQPDHLSGEFFQRLAGVQLIHVPYKGGGPALIDLVSGELQLMFSTYVVAQPYVAANKLRALAVTTPQRQPLLPNLPTVAETVPGFAISNWNGIFAPARTPRHVADLLFAEINAALQDPDLKKRQNGAGIEAIGSPSRASFAEFVRADSGRWATIVKDANIAVE